MLIWKQNPCQNTFHTYLTSWNRSGKACFYPDYHEGGRQRHLGLNSSRGHPLKSTSTPFSHARVYSSVGVCGYPLSVLDWGFCLDSVRCARIPVTPNHWIACQHKNERPPDLEYSRR